MNLNQVKSFIHRYQILSTLILIVTAYLAYQIKDIIFLLLLAYIFVASILPLVNFLTQKGIPRTLSIIILYISLITVLALLIIPAAPFIIDQTQAFVQEFPRYLNQLTQRFNIQYNLESLRSLLTDQFENVASNVFGVVTGIFGGFLNLFTFFAVSFYLLNDHQIFSNRLSKLFNSKKQGLKAIRQIESQLGSWTRGQIILSLFVGLLTWIGFSLIGLPYAIPLSLLAAALEIIPTIGPLIAFTPALILSLTLSPATIVGVIVVYIIVQTLEGNILVPKIMEKTLGLHPLLVLLTVVISLKLLGIIGPLIAVPYIAALSLVLAKQSK